MLAKVKSFGLIGVSGYEIDIEVDINFGLPKFDIVGLPDAGVKESRDRIKGAIKNSGLDYPVTHLIVNMAPADTKKEGPIYDVPISVGVLAASGQLPLEKVKEFAFIGELSLDGSLRRINGLLPILITAKQLGHKKIIIPFENREEARFISGLEVYAIKSLTELTEFFEEKYVIKPLELREYSADDAEDTLTDDFKFVHGQKVAKRALEIAAAGGHNVVMVGPPGSGKTMLAKCLAGILPNLTFNEALEITKIHSVAGTLDKTEGIILKRPIRSPHHTASSVALSGGGSHSKPGEISLAHNGVLFLDELPEYKRNVLETLRQPLEDGVITVSRAALTVEYPANFILVASMNPCPCGHYGSKKVACKCSSSQIHNYLAKLSGPLMDRIDMHIEVDGVDYEKLTNKEDEEPTFEIKKRVDKAREIQLKRYAGSKAFSNSKMNVQQTKKFCELDEASGKLLKHAFEKLNLSARAYNRILKVARTIADLDGSENILFEHVAEAVSYRSLDNKYWS